MKKRSHLHVGSEKKDRKELILKTEIRLMDRENKFTNTKGERKWRRSKLGI